ncbi:MAG: MFS transporter [Bacillota bacterium]
MERTDVTALFTPEQRRRAMALLFGVLLLIMVGFSVLFPIEPYYVRRFGVDAGTMGIIAGTYSAMQFLFSPLWGRLSDRVGRRPVLIVGLLGYVVGQTLFGLATQVWMLFAARTLAGILSAAALPTAMAYIADITPPEDRARGMGLVGAAFGLGVVIGPAMGGALGQVSLSLPFFVSAGLAGAALVAVAAVLPESLPAGARTPREASRASRWSAFAWEVAALYGVTLALSMGMAGIELTFGFFAADRLGLTPRQTSWVFTVMGLVLAAVQGGLVGRLQRRWGEIRMELVGLALAALAMVWVALTRSPVAATCAIALLAAGMGIARPANSALISRRATTGQGTAIGLMDSFDSLGRIIGPVLGGSLYRRGLTLPFLSGAVLFAVALLLAAAWAAGAGPDPAGTGPDPTEQGHA